MSSKTQTNGRPQAQRKSNRNPQSGSRSLQAIAAPAAQAAGQTSGQPYISRTSADSTRIVHREFVRNVSGSTAFAVSVDLAINPGISTTFPWLSTQARGWEKYRFNSIRFCYYTRTGSTTVGSLTLAMCYDAADEPPNNEQSLSAQSNAVEDAPWKQLCCIVDKHRLKELFVRSGPTSVTTDIKTYDVGRFFAGTVDGAAVAWGKLWVEYDITLMNPVLHTVSTTGNLYYSGGAISSTALFRADVVDDANHGGLTFNASSSGNVIRISGMVIDQRYYLTLEVTGTVISALTFSAATPNVTTVVYNPSMLGSGSTTMTCTYEFYATAGIIDFTCGCTATTITSATLRIMSMYV